MGKGSIQADFKRRYPCGGDHRRQGCGKLVKQFKNESDEDIIDI